MVAMLPLRDRTELDRLNAQAGESCAFAYCLYDEKEIAGYLLYDIQKDEAQIRYVSAADADCFDGLVRAVFSSLLDIHINRARFGERVSQPLLEQLAFAAPGERVTPSIEDVLYRCKHCRSDG